MNQASCLAAKAETGGEDARHDLEELANNSDTCTSAVAEYALYNLYKTTNRARALEFLFASADKGYLFAVDTVPMVMNLSEAKEARQALLYMLVRASKGKTAFAYDVERQQLVESLLSKLTVDDYREVIKEYFGNMDGNESDACGLGD